MVDFAFSLDMNTRKVKFFRMSVKGLIAERAASTNSKHVHLSCIACTHNQVPLNAWNDLKKKRDSVDEASRLSGMGNGRRREKVAPYDGPPDGITRISRKRVVARGRAFRPRSMRLDVFPHNPHAPRRQNGKKKEEPFHHRRHEKKNISPQWTPYTTYGVPTAWRTASRPIT